MKIRATPYLALATLFLIAFLYQARFSVEAVRDLAEGSDRAEAPFSIEPPGRLTPAGPAIRSVREEALESGLRRGDILLAVNGAPFRGFSALAVAVASMRPGDELRIRVRRGAEEHDLSVRLVTDTGGPLQGLGGFAFSVWMGLLMPWFCLLVGFWVSLAHPEDRRAWLLVALMLSFAHIVRSPDLMSWQDWLRPLAVGFHSIWNSTWALWVFLFGLYFPEPFAWERRHRWVKWIVIVPFAVLAAVSAVSAVAVSEDYRLAYPIERFFPHYRRIQMPLNMAPLALFLGCIGIKWGTERRPDSRRRLKLLLAGALTSMSPILAFAVYTMLRGRPAGPRTPPWLLFPSLAMLFLFPVTLAYVIVVQRAMDIRVVLRQSVQYALARRGLWAIRAGLGVVIIWWALSLTGRERLSAVETLGIGCVAAAAVIVTQRASERVARSIDRRFFREAYDAERILSELGDEVRTIMEERTVVETVARRISESLHTPRVAVLLSSDAAFTSAPGVAEHLLRTRRPALVYFDDDHSWVHTLAERDRRWLSELGVQLLVPLWVKDRLLGFISLGEKLSEEPYSRTDLRLLESVAAQTALAIDNSQLTAAVAADAARREGANRELEIAREVQERLFPQKLPRIAGLEYAGVCRPARGVGGDYYDFLALPDGNLGIAIGDVSGKGVPAALLMATLQASLRGLAINGVTDLGALMSNLNRLIYDASPLNHFATFFYGQYESGTRRLTYVNAGHNPPMLLRGAEIIRLEAGGTVIGSWPSVVYEQQTLELKPGDLLVIFTDGITEAMNAAEEEFGEQRLAGVLEGARELPVGDVIQRILDAADAFAAGQQQYDDLTLVVLRAQPA